MVKYVCNQEREVNTMLNQIVKALEEQYKTELFYTKTGVENSHSAEQADKCQWYSIQRCLGMMELAQQLGLPYEVAEPMFQEVKEKIYKLKFTP